MPMFSVSTADWLGFNDDNDEKTLSPKKTVVFTRIINVENRNNKIKNFLNDRKWYWNILASSWTILTYALVRTSLYSSSILHGFQNQSGRHNHQYTFTRLSIFNLKLYIVGPIITVGSQGLPLYRIRITNHRLCLLTCVSNSNNTLVPYLAIVVTNLYSLTH